MKYLFLLLITVFGTNLLLAQGPRGMTPDQRVAVMNDSLSLSEAQMEKLQAVFEASGEKLQSLRELEMSREEMRAEMQENRKQVRAEIKKYLTTEQFEKWQAIERKRREEMRSRRESRGRG